MAERASVLDRSAHSERVTERSIVPIVDDRRVLVDFRWMTTYFYKEEDGESLEFLLTKKRTFTLGLRLGPSTILLACAHFVPDQPIAGSTRIMYFTAQIGGRIDVDDLPLEYGLHSATFNDCKKSSKKVGKMSKKLLANKTGNSHLQTVSLPLHWPFA